MALEIGRVCVKTAGREAGRPCVVIDSIDDTYVMITGPKSLTRVKRRKCNIAHLEPMDFLLKLAKNAQDSEVEKLLKAEKVLDQLAGPAIKAPARPRPVKEKPAEAKAEEKKSLRERLLGRAREEKPAEAPKEEKKEAKEEKPAEKPKKPAAKKPAKPEAKVKKPAKKPVAKKK